MASEPAFSNLHQELIDRCRSGDREAQFRIYGLYYKAMYNTSLRIVRDPGEAEDIMQESFLSAFEKIAGYRGKVSFGAWLKRIVINRSLDSLKKRRMYFEEMDEQIAETPQEEEESGPRFNAEQIRKAIMQLPDGFRIVLSLFLLEGYDHEEIAQILDIAPSTSRSQYTRARQKLAELLKKMETE